MASALGVDLNDHGQVMSRASALVVVGGGANEMEDLVYPRRSGGLRMSKDMYADDPGPRERPSGDLRTGPAAPGDLLAVASKILG